MTIRKVLGIIQEYFSSRESMYHWLFWLRASHQLGLSPEIILEEAYFLHKEGAFPIWSQGDKYYIPELDKENNFEWDSDEELPF